MDASGNICVADTSNNRVQKFSATGTWLATWGGLGAGSGPGQFSQPKDVAVDSSGNVYVADSGNNRLQKLNSSGAFITAWSGATPGQNPFSDPRGVALSASRINAVDTNNSRLQTFDSQTTTGWAYNQIGNMTSNNGVSYTYGSKPHAVTQVGAGTFYTYDSNGNMTDRAGMSLTPYQVRGRPWDVENRLVSVPGLADFTYDGDSFRVKKIELGTNIVYANKYYEKNINTGVVTLYYYPVSSTGQALGDKLVAYKQGATLRYVHQDHLTGTSLTTDSSGNLAGSIKYKPYGESRSPSGPLPGQKVTGQRLDETGLYYYNARYYDPGLGRFISADTIVPKPRNPQCLNRYTYALDNPLRHNDPTGHDEDEDRPGWLKVLKGAGQFVRGVGESAWNAVRALQITFVPTIERRRQLLDQKIYLLTTPGSGVQAWEAMTAEFRARYDYRTGLGLGHVVGDLAILVVLVRSGRRGSTARRRTMSYRHITVKKIFDDGAVVRYQVFSPDFNEAFRAEYFGIIEIDRNNRSYKHYDNELWVKYRVAPITAFEPENMKDPGRVERYKGFYSGAWAQSLFEFIQECLRTDEYPDEKKLIA